MDTFKTRSTSRKLVLTVLFTFLVMFALAFLWLKISVAAWLFFEAMVLITMVFCLYITSKNHWEIEFHGTDLVLLNTGNRQGYLMEDLCLSDFVISQSKWQKEHGSFDLRFKNASARLYDVQKHKEFTDYIQKHYQ